MAQRYHIKKIITEQRYQMTRAKRLGPTNIPGVPPCLSRTRLLQHIRRTWLLNKYNMKRKYKGGKETCDDFEKRVGMKRTESDAKIAGTEPPNDILVQRMSPTASGRLKKFEPLDTISSRSMNMKN